MVYMCFPKFHRDLRHNNHQAEVSCDQTGAGCKMTVLFPVMQWEESGHLEFLSSTFSLMGPVSVGNVLISSEPQFP